MSKITDIDDADLLNIGEKDNGFLQKAISVVIFLIAIVCLLSLVVFTCMLIFSQNDLRVLSNQLLSENKSGDEMASITYFINTLHSMQTVVDHNQILALIYSILSTICIGICVYCLKIIYARQKDLSKKAKDIEKMFEGFETKDRFNSLCNALYSYCTAYRLYYCFEIKEDNRGVIENGINECFLHIRRALTDCEKLAKCIKERKLSPSNMVSLTALGYAKTALEAFKNEVINKEMNASTKNMEDIEKLVERMQKIIDDLSEM